MKLIDAPNDTMLNSTLRTVGHQHMHAEEVGLDLTKESYQLKYYQ